ncbi:MAG: hypothetical protein Q9187_004881 [Circinaria calcarea]
MSSSDIHDPSYLPPQSAQPRSTTLPDDIDELSSSDVSNVASPKNGDIPIEEEKEESHSSGDDSQSSFQDSEELPIEAGEQVSRSPSLEALRPNKFHGPPSTWRSWTAADRAIANSLDQVKAADLSIHLYNAHALKKRQKLLKAKADDENSMLEYGIWEPPKQWTAWPMTAAEVPRNQLSSFGEPTKDEHVWRSLEQQRGSGQDLNGALMAVFLKEAKERFLQRESEGEDLDSDASLDDTKSRRSRSKSKHADGDTHRWPSKATKPVILADDEKANSILEPTIRHILVKVDKLLMDLHCARQAYLPTVDESQSETQTDADDETRSQEKAEALRKKRKTKRGRSQNSPDSETSANCNQAPSRASSRPPMKKRRKSISSTLRTRSRSRRRRELGLRDWGDILSIASMTGWNQSTIRRTAKRCADLFGEGIEFRTLREGNDEMRETTYLPTLIPEDETAQSDDDFENSLSDTSPKPLSARIANGILYCPVTDCSRSKRGFARNWNFQKHLKEMHGNLVSTVESEDEMFGAVHVNGFLKPIKARKGWRGRATGKRGRGAEEVDVDVMEE